MKLKTIAIAALIALAAGCSSPLAEKQAHSSQVGSLRLVFPALASWVTSHLPTVNDPAGARALITVSAVKIEIETADGDPVIEPQTGSTTSTQFLLNTEIPQGTNYTVKVSVYNTAVSSVEPVVTGLASGVDIVGGTVTSVGITCLPVNPQGFDGTDTLELADEAEAWYSLDVTAGESYQFSETTDGVSFGVFDSAGAYIGTGSSSYVWKATYTGTLYLGVVNSSGESAEAVLSGSQISTFQEGTSGAPVALVDGVPRPFVVSDSAFSYYAFTSGADGGFHLLLGLGDVDYTVYSDSGLTDVVAGGTTNEYLNLSDLSASTLYYLVLQSSEEATQAFQGTPLSVSVSSLSTSASYTAQNLSPAGRVLWYRITVTAGTNYDISWDDSFSGSGAYTLDAKVSVFGAHLDTTYFFGVDSGYAPPRRIHVSNEHAIYVAVQGYLPEYSGSFGLRVAPAE